MKNNESLENVSYIQVNQQVFARVARSYPSISDTQTNYFSAPTQPMPFKIAEAITSIGEKTIPEVTILIYRHGIIYWARIRSKCNKLIGKTKLIV